MNIKRRQNQTYSSGLTLVELLVAITILAIVAVLGWRGLDSILRSRTALEYDLEQVRDMQLSFAQMQRDCEQIIRTSDLGSLPVLSFRKERLILVRKVHLDQQALHLKVVSYRLGENRLTRRESRPTRNVAELNTLWQSAINRSTSNTPIHLQSRLSGMTFRYWPRSGREWHNIATDKKDFAGSSNLPAGLEVTLQGANQTRIVKAMLVGNT